MLPVVLCLLCFLAMALWITYSAMSWIRALIIALGETIYYTVCGFLIFGIAYLCFNVIIIIFTDIPVLWKIIQEFFNSLGGIGGIVSIIIMLIVLGAIGALLLPFGSILFAIVASAIGAVFAVFGFIEDKSKYAYSIVVTQIADRLMKYQDGDK